MGKGPSKKLETFIRVLFPYGIITIISLPQIKYNYLKLAGSSATVFKYSVLLWGTIEAASFFASIAVDQKGSWRGSAGPKELEIAEKVFFAIRLVVPNRLRKEDEGDALEVIGRLVQEGHPRVLVYVKLATSIFWILCNVLRELLALIGRKAPTGKG